MTDLEYSDKEILYSREVKAGKRIYYFDVKCDRNGAYYISLTESKRIKAGTEVEKPVFEKHKIFFYVEDMDKIHQALDEVMDYVRQRQPKAEAGSLLDDLNIDL